MDIQELWENALRKTEIVRPRVLPLETFSATRVPYIFLSESILNPANTAVRKGEIVVEKPSLVMPFNLPQFEGFSFEEEMNFSEDALTNFLLVRGISLPSFKYNNKAGNLEVFSGKLSKAIESHQALLQRNEDVHTGLVMGPGESWQLSVLIFACQQVMRSADGDIRKLWDKFK